MALIKVRNNKTKVESVVSEEWLSRWPDDFTAVESPKVLEPIEESKKPSTGVSKKEKA